jgi:transposase-like protein
MERFGGDQKCRDYLEALRWPKGPVSLRCQSEPVSPIAGRDQHICLACHYQFSVTAGTIFQDTHLPLTKWFMATYLIVESKKSISANQIKRTIGVSYKTAWYLCHRIREAMKNAADVEKLSGIVEVDETYIGGKRKGIGRENYRPYQTAVIGAVQRGGPIRFNVIPKTDRTNLHAVVKAVTKPETEAIYTDEERSYKGIGDEDTRHEAVNHSAGEYVRADVHTNTVESAWSLFKRSIAGAYPSAGSACQPSKSWAPC